MRGRVELAPAPIVSARRPAAGELGDGPPRDVLEPRRAVVYFESAPKGAFEDREGGRARMDQRNETFVPHVLAIAVGTVVDFPNIDRIYHNVFSLSKARRFDLGRYAAGHSKSVRFDRPGIVRVFCDIHSHMSAFILVFSHPFFSRDRRGRRTTASTTCRRAPTRVVAWNEGVVRRAQDRRRCPPAAQATLDFVLR